MKHYVPWMILILPIAIALPTEDIDLNEDEPAFVPNVSPRLWSVEEFLQENNIPNLRSLKSCRWNHPDCPFVKENLIKYVENICKINNYAPRSVGDLKDSATMPTGREIPSPPPDISMIKSKFQNEVASASMIYLLLWTYGSSLQSEKFQQFNEYYRNTDKTFRDFFKSINTTLNSNGQKQLLKVLYEKTNLDEHFNLTAEEIKSNLTKQQDLLTTVVTEIQHDNYFLAVKKYKELGDEEFLPTIIGKIAIQRLNLETIDKLLKFIRTLQSQEDKLVAYIAMLKYDLGYSIFQLEHDFYTMGHSILKFMSSESSPRTFRLRFESIQTRLKEEVGKAVARITLTINTLDSSHMQDIIEYTRHHADPYHEHIIMIVEDIFQDKSGKKLDFILAFADNFTQIEQTARVYMILIRRLALQEKWYFKYYLKIAAKIKQLTLMKNYNNTQHEIREELEIVKEQLPPEVKSLVWGKVCIRNRNARGFLHRNPGRNVNITQDPDIWELEISTGNQFKIRHSETNEYLYATDGKEVLTGPEGDENLLNQFWSFGRLIYIQNDGDYVYIKNEELGEFLGFRDNPGRNVTSRDAITERDEMTERISNDEINYYTKNLEFNQEWYFKDSNDC